MNTKTIAALAPGALVTDNPDAFTIFRWVGIGLFAIALLSIVVAWGKRKDEEVLDSACFCAMIFLCLGAATVLISLVIEDNEVLALDQNRVTEVISEQYRLTSIEPAAKEGRRGPTQADLCAPVSPESPEYVGVVDGQQIRFKAGSTNCTRADPDVTIIVTHTPGTALSADDLRKDNTTEEP